MHIQGQTAAILLHKVVLAWSTRNVVLSTQNADGIDVASGLDADQDEGAGTHNEQCCYGTRDGRLSFKLKESCTAFLSIRKVHTHVLPEVYAADVKDTCCAAKKSFPSDECLQALTKAPVAEEFWTFVRTHSRDDYRLLAKLTIEQHTQGSYTTSESRAQFQAYLKENDPYRHRDFLSQSCVQALKESYRLPAELEDAKAVCHKEILAKVQDACRKEWAASPNLEGFGTLGDDLGAYIVEIDKYACKGVKKEMIRERCKQALEKEKTLPSDMDSWIAANSPGICDPEIAEKKYQDLRLALEKRPLVEEEVGPLVVSYILSFDEGGPRDIAYIWAFITKFLDLFPYHSPPDFNGMVKPAIKSITNRELFAKRQLEENSTVYVIGDLHGEMEQLLYVLTEIKKQAAATGITSETGLKHLICHPKLQYVFLGDFVDRGKYDYQILLLVLGFRELCPGSVTLLRGNHEDATINERDGFMKSLRRNLGTDTRTALTILTQYIQPFVYDQLPYFLIIHGPDGKPAVWLQHAGLDSRFEQRSIDGGLESTFSGIDGLKTLLSSHPKPLDDLLWNDPKELDRHGEWGGACVPNIRGGGAQECGSETYATFSKTLGTPLILRGHQVQMEGANVWPFEGGALYTVHTDANYKQALRNCGSYVKLHTDNLRQPLVYMHTHVHDGSNFESGTSTCGCASYKIDCGARTLEEVSLLEAFAVSTMAHTANTSGGHDYSTPDEHVEPLTTDGEPIPEVCKKEDLDAAEAKARAVADDIVKALRAESKEASQIAALAKIRIDEVGENPDQSDAQKCETDLIQDYIEKALNGRVANGDMQDMRRDTTRLQRERSRRDVVGNNTSTSEVVVANTTSTSES
jgi:hypothetical protein